MGLGFLVHEWLADRSIVMLTMFVVISWKYFGFHMILMLAGLQGIPRELEEAAAIDGATRRQTVRSVTLPLLGPTIRVSVFLSIIGAIQLFDLVWATTRGGPFNASNTMAIYLVDYGIERTQMGYGSADRGHPVRRSALVVALALPALRDAPRHRGRRDHWEGAERWRRSTESTSTTALADAPHAPGRGRAVVGGVIRWVVLLAVAVAIIVPIGYAFLGGFRTTGAIRNDPAGFPTPGSFDNYVEHPHRRHCSGTSSSTASSSRRITVVVVVARVGARRLRVRAVRVPGP